MKIIRNRSLPLNAKTQSRRDKRSTQVTPLDFSAAWRAGFSALDSIRVALLATAAVLLPAAAQADGAIEAWAQRYNGPGNGGDTAWGIAVDTNGNVYVTGESYGSGPGSDFATIKYSGAGVPLWTNRFNGLANDDDGDFGIAVDPTGNVVVTGWSLTSARSYDYVTIKYSTAGVPLWTSYYNGPGNGPDWGMYLALDSAGNVFVTGMSTGSGGNLEYATLKYSSAGVPLWTNRYHGPGIDMNRPRALAVDASGNVVVTGESPGNGTSYDYATIKYSAAGVPLWTNRYNGPVDGWDEPRSIAIDASGNVIVTGRSDGSTNAWNDDSLTIKYSSAGVPLWTNRYGALADHDDEANAVAVDVAGNVFVTGRSDVNDVSADYATIKYSSAGIPIWTNFYNGPANKTDAATAIALDVSGNVFVTGSSYDQSLRERFATVGYSSTGVPLWTNRYSGPGYADRPASIAVDASGSVVVAGRSDGSDTSSDFVTVKYVVPPIITCQPLSRTNLAGSTVSFTVEAVGGVPLSYQWRRQGTNLLNAGNLSGVTTANLQIANAQLADAASYSVVVTNAYGSVTSSLAQLTVIVSPGQFTRLGYSPETGFSFIFRDATAGQPYRIQRSPSLTEGSWTDWLYFTYDGAIGIMDVDATGAERRFYRAVSP
jgi:uncharacterized delta-60 repeat protein